MKRFVNASGPFFSAAIKGVAFGLRLCLSLNSRLIPVIPFSAELQRIWESIETVAEDRIRL